MTHASEARDRLLEFALGLPGAYEDFPWGERVVKVNKKIFVFLGPDGDPGSDSVCVKLADSYQQALAVPGATLAGYGLGKAGWVVVPLASQSPPVEVLNDWVEESYRKVAPKRLVNELDQQSAH